MSNTTTSTRHRRPRAACSHFHAEPVGTTEARMRADGRWVYRRTYECGDCGATFTEQHTARV